MIKRYRFRLYPDADQVQFLARSFGCARVVFNDGLAAREAAFASGAKAPSTADLMKAMAASKKSPARSWLAEVSDVPLQQSLRDLDRAYTDFFRRFKSKSRRAGRPRFKSRRDGAQSLRFTRAHFRIEPINRHKAMLRLPKMSPLRMNLSRPLPGPASSVTVIREADGRYYASFVVEVPACPAPEPRNRVAGIDLGLNHLAVIASDDGAIVKVENPRYLRRQLRKLAAGQKELARRTKGSKNREKSRIKVAALHRKVREARADHHHKLARKIVDENQVIGLETLSVTGLGRTRLAKSVHDAGWGILIRLIKEKAFEAGRTVICADRFFPSTRLCGDCGAIGETLPLSVRTWTCGCGSIHDRDGNAAINLRTVAAGQVET